MADKAELITFENLLGSLAKRLSVKGLDRTVLNMCRMFYLRYPQICETLSHKFKELGIIGQLRWINVENTEISAENVTKTLDHLKKRKIALI